MAVDQAEAGDVTPRWQLAPVFIVFGASLLRSRWQLKRMPVVEDENSAGSFPGRQEFPAASISQGPRPEPKCPPGQSRIAGMALPVSSTAACSPYVTT